MVADHIRRQIVLGDLTEGALLPPERDLTAAYGVSGPTLRAAYRVLESEGLIRVHRGATGGATVHRPSLGACSRSVGLLLQANGTTLTDLFEARILLEPPLAAAVAAKTDRSIVAELRALVAAEVVAVDDPHGFSRATNAFHAYLVATAGSDVVETLVNLLWGVFELHATDAIVSAGVGVRTRSQRAAAHRAHARLTELIEAGDAEGAERFWRQHMTAVGRLFQKRYGTTSLYQLLH